MFTAIYSLILPDGSMFRMPDRRIHNQRYSYSWYSPIHIDTTSWRDHEGKVYLSNIRYSCFNGKATSGTEPLSSTKLFLLRTCHFCILAFSKCYEEPLNWKPLVMLKGYFSTYRTLIYIVYACLGKLNWVPSLEVFISINFKEGAYEKLCVRKIVKGSIYVGINILWSMKPV